MLLTLLLSIGLLCSTLLTFDRRPPLGAIVTLEAVDTLGVTAAAAVAMAVTMAVAVAVVGTEEAEAEVGLVVLLEMIGGGLIDGRRRSVRV